MSQNYIKNEKKLKNTEAFSKYFKFKIKKKYLFNCFDKFL